MTCGSCGRTIPVDAVFCIYCAAPVAPPKPAEREPAPATGPTVRLDPEVLPPAVKTPRRAVIVPAATVQPARKRRARRQGPAASMVVLVVGALLLLINNAFWPGILLVVGLSKVVGEHARGQGGRAFGHLFFWGGLAFLFWTGRFFPGILILIAASHMLGHGHRRAFP